MKRVVICSFITLSLLGCGVKESEHHKVVTQRDSLQLIVTSLMERVDMLENGEDRLMNFIILHNNNKNYIKAAENIDALKKFHPESQLMTKHSKLFSEIEGKAQILKDSIDKAVRDSIKLASITNIGRWEIGNYVNDFDEPTGDHYVFADFYGTFSNSATAGRELRIRVYITPYDTYLKYDEYDNGVYTDEMVSYGRIVNKEKRKVYDIRGYSYIDQETKEYVNLDDILKDEGVYDFDVKLKYGTRYHFTINSCFLNNALVKAKLITLDDFLNTD